MALKSSMKTKKELIERQKDNSFERSPLMQALTCKNEKKANKDAALLIAERVMNLAYGPNDSWNNKRAWTNKDKDAVIALIQDINPKDAIEAQLVAQFIALNLKSMSLIQRENYNIMGHALMMMRLSHQALDMLQKYRGKSQTINVNYNTLNQAETILNSMAQIGRQQEKGT